MSDEPRYFVSVNQQTNGKWGWAVESLDKESFPLRSLGYGWTTESIGGADYKNAEAAILAASKCLGEQVEMQARIDLRESFTECLPSLSTSV